VGRSRELDAILRSLPEVEQGRGKLVVLSGEPGIGKTSLADATAALAEERGFSVHWGRCWESGGAPAYFPWLGVLSSMALTLDDQALSRALGDGAPVLAELLPELRQRLPPVSAGAPPPPEEARFRVFRAIVALTRERARLERRGLLIVLDDLHAADRSSLLLLHFLSRELRGLRVLLLATYRDVEARMEPETSGLVARIGREGECFTLSRLGVEDAADIVSAHAGSVTPRVSERIVERAQGNPLFLEEMLRLLAEQGPDSIDAGVVPHGVRDVIGQRLGRVNARTRALLELGAVSGDDFEPWLLASASDDDDASVSAALSEAGRAGILVERGERRRFAHALFREVLYRELPIERRRKLHEKIGEALRRSVPPGTTPPHAKLAHHALEGPPELLPLGVEHALAAARRAQELLAYDDAVETLERALAVVTASDNPPKLRAPVLVALGEACIRRGDGATGKRHCREAASIARTLGDAELAARAALTYGRVFSFGNVDPILVGLLEDSLEALPAGENALRARLLGRLAAALQPSTHIEEPLAVARDAIRIARGLGDQRALLEVMHDAISAMMDCTDPAEAKALNLQAEALALELGDRECLLRTHGRLFFIHLSFGELDLADARLQAYEELAKELAAPWLGFRSLYCRALRATIHGRFAEAQAYLDEALSLGSTMQDAIALGLYRSCREGLMRASERHDELLGPDSMARSERGGYRFMPVWQAIHAGLAHARREEAEQVRVYFGLVPDAFPQNFFTYFYLAEMAALAGTDAEVEKLLALMESTQDEYLALGWSYVGWEGPKARFLALLFGRLRRFEEASAAFEEALAKLRRLEALPYLARTEYEYARMLLERGSTDDVERARTLLASARERAISLGMPGLIRLIERRGAGTPGLVPPLEREETLPLENAPVPGPVPSAVEPESGLTLALEGEYFALRFRSETLRMKDSLGLRYLARLVETPGREFHVLELVRERSGASDAGELLDRGDAGELLDEAARKAYRKRLEELEDAVAEAESFGDASRADRARTEIEMLASELGRAVGLGGRARKAGAAGERARSAVQRRIRHAIDRIATKSPALASFLERSIRTGNYCSFVPVADRSVR
jgi:tetratricopeptide (TPR) repeat protein